MSPLHHLCVCINFVMWLSHVYFLASVCACLIVEMLVQCECCALYGYGRWFSPFGGRWVLWSHDDCIVTSLHTVTQSGSWFFFSLGLTRVVQEKKKIPREILISHTLLKWGVIIIYTWILVLIFVVVTTMFRPWCPLTFIWRAQWLKCYGNNHDEDNSLHVNSNQFCI